MCFFFFWIRVQHFNVNPPFTCFVIRLLKRNYHLLSQAKKQQSGAAAAAAALAPAEKPRQCGVCNKADDLLRCSRCKVQWYCGPQHQREHWVLHRQSCRQPTPEEEAKREQVCGLCRTFGAFQR